jgi:SAM-dependent methyltransferase
VTREPTITPGLSPRAIPEFDAFASRYDEALDEGLGATGETKDYFARRRTEWLGRRLRELGARPSVIVDFGCGTGSSVPYLLDLPGCVSVHGADISEASLAVARREQGAANVTFGAPNDSTPGESVDLAFCNGVFHHIPPAERAGALRWIRRVLRPGGVFALWENNPWNPGTRYIMSRVPFDRDAITITPPEARGMLRQEGFELLRTDFLFVFPAFLRWLRPIERLLIAMPVGGQYLVLARKPAKRRNS